MAQGLEDGWVPGKTRSELASKVGLVCGVVASIIFGLYILAFDDHIWEHASSHAYCLAVVTGVYIALLALMQLRPKIAGKAIMVVAAIQFVAMNLDILTTQEMPVFQVQGLSSEELFEHLYGSWYFDALLGVQVLLIVLASWSRRTQELHSGSFYE